MHTGVVFQSTHPVRGATASADKPIGRAEFQSTHPVRGATGEVRTIVFDGDDFNPRTP